MLNLSTGPTGVGAVESTRAGYVVDRARRRICVAPAGASEIRCADDHDKRTIIRWQPDSVPFTAADRQAFEARLRKNFGSRGPGGEADADAYLAAIEWPARYNPFSVLRIDDAGNFWILEPALDASGAMHRRFRIIDPDGRHIAFADSFPVRPVGIGSPTSIGASSIVRAFEDADGVPKVGVFRIRKED
jgi:hypothetical protein